jgi:dTDP-4-amino-4,6-dideoxygalactose transaminase
MEAFERLEREFGQWVNGQHRPENYVACSSGTAALHLALEALDLPRGSRVIVPEMTMIACARAVVLAGLTPVFVDCGDDLLIDLDHQFKTKVGRDGFDWRGISAIMPVYVYGRVPDMPAIYGLAQEYDLKVVLDRAEAHGARPDGYITSWDGYASCWSFYRNKIVAGEEGGMVSFGDPAAAQKARQLRTLGFTDRHDFLHVPRGHNYRMSNVHAGLVLDSLLRADVNLERRRQVEAWYDDAIPDEWRMPERDVVWVYDIRVPELGYERMDRVVHNLNAQGIAARHSFKPMSAQPEFKYPAYDLLRLNADRLSKEVIYLPVDPLMDEGRVREIGARTVEALGLVGHVGD